jgi:hypothetical protein
MGWSKEERAEYMRNWRANNKDKLKIYRRTAYEKSLLNGTYVYIPPDKEKLRQWQAKYREKNREKIAEYQKNYQRMYREKHREEYNSYHRQYQAKLRQNST